MRDEIGVDFSFKGFIKFIFYIANLELQLIRKTEPRKSYLDIVNALREESNHIVHYSLELRKKDKISIEEKQLWLDKAELYVKNMKEVIKNSLFL